MAIALPGSAALVVLLPLRDGNAGARATFAAFTRPAAGFLATHAVRTRQAILALGIGRAGLARLEEARRAGRNLARTAGAAAVSRTNLALRCAVARATARSAVHVGLADRSPSTLPTGTGKSDRRQGVAAGARGAAVGTARRNRCATIAAALGISVAVDVVAFAGNAARAVAAAEQSRSAAAGTAKAIPGHRGEASAALTLACLGAIRSSAERAAAVGAASALSCRQQSRADAVLARTTLSKTPTPSGVERLRIVQAKIVRWAGNGGAPRVGWRWRITVPAGAARLANAIAGGVTANPRAAGSLYAMTLGTIRVARARCAQRLFSGDGAGTVAITAPGALRAGASRDLVYADTLPGGPTLAK